MNLEAAVAGVKEARAWSLELTVSPHSIRIVRMDKLGNKKELNTLYARPTVSRLAFGSCVGFAFPFDESEIHHYYLRFPFPTYAKAFVQAVSNFANE